MILLTFLIGLAAVIAATVFCVVRGLPLWRQAKTHRRHVLDRGRKVRGALRADRAPARARPSARTRICAAAHERLRVSRARLQVLLDALERRRQRDALAARLPARTMTRVAAVDLGTNSTRLLVADVEGDRLEEVVRRLTITRLGEGVDERRRLLPVPIARVRNTLTDYRRELEELGATRTLAIGTSAIRDAENGEAFLGEIEWSYGFKTRLLDGDEEAAMMLRGVAAGRDAPLERRRCVVDIGGGSTELVVSQNGARRRGRRASTSAASGSPSASSRRIRRRPRARRRRRPTCARSSRRPTREPRSASPAP